MKKWMKYLLMPVLLVTAFSGITASAKNIATAVLEKAQDSNQVTIAIDFSESRTEVITSLRFKMLVAVEEGELKKEDVSFTFADIPGKEKDAEIVYDESVGDYVIDIIISGEENIFEGAKGIPLTIGTLNLPDGEGYYAEVGLVAYDDGDEAQGSDDLIVGEEELFNAVSVLEYVENVGVDVMRLELKADTQIEVGKKTPEKTPEPEITPQPETSPEPEVTPQPEATLPPEPAPEPQPQTTPEPAPETVPQPQTTPEPAPEPQTTPEPVPQPQTTPEPAPKPEPEPQTTPEPAPEPVPQPDTTVSAETDSPQSETAASGTNTFKQTKPVLTVKAVTGTKKLKFSWKKVSGADGYQIVRYSSKKGKYTKIATVGKGTSYTARYKSGKRYKFKIRAFRKGKNGKNVYGPYSSSVSVRVSAFDKTKKTALQVKQKLRSRKVVFTWKKVTGADGYRIYQYDAGTGKYKKLTTINSGKTVSFVSEKKYGYAKTYKFRIRPFALDENGRKVLGASCTYNFKSRPAKAKELTVESTETAKVTVSWEKVKRADGYWVYRKGADEESYTRIGQVDGNEAQSYTDETALSGEAYEYCVRAVTLDGEGVVRRGAKSIAQSVNVM